MCTRTVEAFFQGFAPEGNSETMSVGFLAQTLIDFLLMSCCASKLDSLEFERRTHAQCFALVEDTQWNRQPRGQLFDVHSSIERRRGEKRGPNDGPAMASEMQMGCDPLSIRTQFPSHATRAAISRDRTARQLEVPYIVRAYKLQQPLVAGSCVTRDAPFAKARAQHLRVCSVRFCTENLNSCTNIIISCARGFILAFLLILSPSKRATRRMFFLISRLFINVCRTYIRITNVVNVQYQPTR